MDTILNFLMSLIFLISIAGIRTTRRIIGKVYFQKHISAVSLIFAILKAGVEKSYKLHSDSGKGFLHISYDNNYF